MKRCWIHIGMPKTGSTSIQSNLGKVKCGPGWKILRVGGSANMNLPLLAMFASNKVKENEFAKRAKSPEEVAALGMELRKKLRRVIKKAEEETLIISGEVASSMDQAGVIALKKFITPLVDEVRILGYVRPPFAFKNSMFQQRHKFSLRKFTFDDIKVNYRSRFEKFDKAFGRQNVVLRKFDPATFTNQCIVTDFCEQVGIPPIDPDLISRSNDSLCREACGLLYAYRKFKGLQGIGPNFELENNIILDPMRDMKGTKFKVAMSVVGPALEAELDDRRWMEKRLGESLDENVAADGTEVTSEDDLLTIRRAACVDYAAQFEIVHGVVVPADKIPAEDPVSPQHAADFVEYCRRLCAPVLAAKLAKARKRAKKNRLR